MSIVGPRPLFDDDTQLFNTKYMRRLNVLPGITGCFKLMNGIPLNLKHGINMTLNILKIGVYI